MGVNGCDTLGIVREEVCLMYGKQVGSEGYVAGDKRGKEKISESIPLIMYHELFPTDSYDASALINKMERVEIAGDLLVRE